MEARFVPRNYRLELIQKIHALTQGSKTVEEYRAEMEMLMLRANYQDEDNGRMFRFFQGLRQDIRNLINMFSYTTLGELTQLAPNAEAQLKE